MALWITTTDISFQSCVCARVGNSHTFELYKKNGDGIFEKVTEENDNNLMVLARGPGRFKLGAGHSQLMIVCDPL